MGFLHAWWNAEICRSKRRGSGLFFRNVFKCFISVLGDCHLSWAVLTMHVATFQVVGVCTVFLHQKRLPRNRRCGSYIILYQNTRANHHGLAHMGRCIATPLLIRASRTLINLATIECKITLVCAYSIIFYFTLYKILQSADGNTL